jgi:hypothetical protein
MESHHSQAVDQLPITNYLQYRKSHLPITHNTRVILISSFVLSILKLISFLCFILIGTNFYLKIIVYISVFIEMGDNSFTKIFFKLKHIKILKK